MKQAWSTRRTVKAAQKVLDRLGCSFVQHGYIVKGASTYLITDGLTIRVSDHAQPEYGGYNLERGERHGKADYSLDPTSPGVMAFQVWLVAKINEDNLPYFVRLEEVAALGAS